MKIRDTNIRNCQYISQLLLSVVLLTANREWPMENDGLLGLMPDLMHLEYFHD